MGMEFACSLVPPVLSGILLWVDAELNRRDGDIPPQIVEDYAATILGMCAAV
jgi:hypothetical protein